jgi:hypothetical protein
VHTGTNSSRYCVLNVPATSAQPFARGGRFFELVLSENTEEICVASLGEIGWSDLGDPRRLTTLLETEMESPWVSSGFCNQCGASFA